MNNINNLIRADLRDFNSYSSARDEASRGEIWLNANESPYPLTTQEGLLINRYPEKQPSQLIKKLAELYAVKADQILLSRGSDEVIDLLTRLFCTAGKDAILTCPPTFGMYNICGKLQAARLIEVPLSREKYQLDVEKILSYENSGIKIIFLCSPNNPTGNTLKAEDIFRLCKHYANKSIIVVDEAYIEFSDEQSLSAYINDYENLVILRTFSKAYGLAGARCGVLLAQKEIVQWINKIIAPYPLSVMTAQLISQAMTSTRLTQIKEQIACIKSERDLLFEKLNVLTCVKKVWPSQANFLLVEVNNIQKILQGIAKQGIIIRSMQSKLFLENAIRITIGLPNENSKLLTCMNGMK